MSNFLDCSYQKDEEKWERDREERRMKAEERLVIIFLKLRRFNETAKNRVVIRLFL